MGNSKLVPWIIAPTLNIDDLEVSNKQVSLEGTVNKIRDIWKVIFIVLTTSRDYIQCVVEWDIINNARNLKVWSHVRLIWEVVSAPTKVYKSKELRVKEIQSLSVPHTDLATIMAWHLTRSLNIDSALNNRPITLRNVEQKAIFKLQEGISLAFQLFFTQNWFTRIISPCIVAWTAEWGANVFKLDYFGKNAFLRQSPQFYKQYMVWVYQRVYEIWPVFRAEKHATARHLNEYTSMDIEMWFIKSFRDIMSAETAFLQFLMEYLQENYKKELNLLWLELPCINNWIPEIDFHEVKEIISNIYNRPIADPDDLEPEEERLISDYIKKQTWSQFVFVTWYPAKKRPFYAMLTPWNPNKTESFDLLFKWIEITTWGQRVHEYQMQLDRLREKWLPEEWFKDFLELHRNWIPPHWWFWMWLERLTASLIWQANIRWWTLFPRDLNRLT